MAAEATQSRFRVTGMDCATFASNVDTAVRRVPGVVDVAVSVSAGTLRVVLRSEVTDDAVVRQVRNLGYGVDPAPASGDSSAARTSVEPVNAHHDEDQPDHTATAQPAKAAFEYGHAHDHGSPSDQAWWRTKKAQATAACGVALLLAYGLGQFYPAIERPAFLAALAIGLIPVAWRAFTAARYGTPFSIETLMTIAAVGAVFIGAEEEAAAVVLLFLVCEMLEGVAAGRARASIRGLTALVPKTAIVEENGEAREVPAESLAVGSIILVRPGDRIPVDVTITEGTGEVDEAPVTGKTVPKRKAVGDPVFAGTINAGGVLRARVAAAAADNTIARVVRQVEEAQESKSPTERLIDHFSRYYTPPVFAVGALVAVVPSFLFAGAWNEWIYKGLAILLIGCPCALVISTPAAIAAGLSAGARRGQRWSYFSDHPAADLEWTAVVVKPPVSHWPSSSHRLRSASRLAGSNAASRHSSS